jgi:hypothetical protein
MSGGGSKIGWKWNANYENVLEKHWNSSIFPSQN